MSGSHASDEGGTSPKIFDGANRRLSVSTGTSERPETHTEEWVRVSNFDVWTPKSTTARSDNDATAEDSYSEVQMQDKLVDWETVSRENAGNSSSAEDVGETENVAVEYSSGSGHDHGQEHVDKVISDSSGKEDDDVKSVNSRSDGGKSSHSSSSSSSSSSAVRSSATFPKKSDDEERSSSTVVVPPHEDESQESSYAEVTSIEARDDDDHGITANFPSPGSKGVQSSTIEPVTSSDEQEGENYESFGGVENEDMSSTMEPVSSEEEEEEEEKYRLFSDVSNVKSLLEQEEASDDLPSRYDSYASFLASRMKEPESKTHDSSEVTVVKTETPGVLEEEHPTRGRFEMEEHQAPEAKEVGPEVKGTEQPVVEGVRPDILASDQNLQAGGNIGEELAESIEPTTPEKASEKSGSENPYTFERSISDEELPEQGKQETAQDSSENSPKVQDVDESIAKEFQDAPSSSSGVPEPDQHELNQLLEIAHSKEIAKLGKQEEKLVAQEEQDLGKGIVVEPLVEVLSATDDPKPLEGGEVKDLQPVVAEEAPLLKDSPNPVVSEFQVEAELKEKAPELFSKESEDELHEPEFAGKERQILEGKLSEGGSSSSSSFYKEPIY